MEKEFKWSKYQEAIFDEVKNGTGNIVVEARAGSAKTSSLIEATNHLPKDAKILLCAFNKRIQEELQSKISNGNVKCQTIHSLGFSAIRKTNPYVQVDSRKMDDVINSLRFNIPEKEYSKIMQALKKTCSLAKSLLQDVPSKIKSIIIKYEIDHDPYNIDEFAKMAFDCLEKCKTVRNVIDFDDMVWFPIIFDLPFEKFTHVFGDEAQDFSPMLLKALLKTKKENTRFFIFLDEKQAIYQFMGSDDVQVAKMIDELGGKKLPLPICYRCPNKVIELAKKYASNIESFPGNKDGEVSTIKYSEMYKIIPQGSFIISRYNAPLVPVYFSLIKYHKPCAIIGKDIGNNLLTIVKKTKSKTIESFNAKIETMRAAEIAKAKKERRKFDLIDDKFDCLVSIAETCKTVKELSEKINKMFSDDANNTKISLMSTHKSKGLENNDVYLLNSTFSPDSVDQSERNIFYVALSRSKDKLYFVEKDENNKKSKK